MENNNLAVQESNTMVAEASAKRDLMNMVFKQAQFYASSTIVPKEYQNNPSNCFIAIEMANRMKANPFQIMQSLNIIQGRPAWSSSFIIGTINQCGRFKTQLNYKMGGSWTTKDLWCIAFATSNDGTTCESIKVTYQMAMDEGWANKNGSKWKTMPELMIRYRAASFFGKQFCPDLLLGLMSAEESMEIVPASYEEVESASYKNVEEVNKEQIKANASIKVDENGVVNKPVQQPQQAQTAQAEQAVEVAPEDLFNYGN